MLQSKGLKPDAILKQWNEVATKESQITGQKRVGLLALLTAPTEVAQLLVQHSSEFKAWAGRLVMTPASLTLMCRSVDARQAPQPLNPKP